MEKYLNIIFFFCAAIVISCIFMTGSQWSCDVHQTVESKKIWVVSPENALSPTRTTVRAAIHADEYFEQANNK